MNNVDRYAFCAGDAGFAHSSSNHGRVGGLTTTAGQYALRSEESVYILGLGLFSNQDNLLSRSSCRFRSVCIKNALA